MSRSIAVCAVLIIACRTPARIETPAGDTIIVNAKGPAALPVRGVTSRGKPARARLSYAVLRGNAVLVAGDTVACREKGDARVRISAGRISRDVTILCRPFRSITLLEPVSMAMGSLPKPLVVGAYDEHDRPLSELAYGLEVMDTSVVVVTNGSLVPRGAGSTYIRVHIGGCMADLVIHVVDPAAEPPTKPSWVQPRPIPREKMCGQLLSLKPG